MGKNLIPYPYSDTTKVSGGITFTDNGDGTITVNGVATGNAYFNVFYYGKLTGVAAGDTVKLTGCPSGGSKDTYYITMQGATDTGSGAEFIVADWMIKDPAIELYIEIETGTTMNNAVFKPRLEKITSVGDKLLEIAENQEKVYQAGKDFMVDETTIIEKTVTGVGSVTVDDVSEAKHEVGVKVKFDGKNYLPIEAFSDDYETDPPKGLSIKRTGDTYAINGSNETGEVLENMYLIATTIINEDGGWATIDPSKKYRYFTNLSKYNDDFYNFFCYVDAYTADSNNITSFELKDGDVVPVSENIYWEIYIGMNIEQGATFDNVTFSPKIMCEDDISTTLTVTGSTSTKTYPINPDGTVSDVYSQCPKMTLATDGAQTDIEVKYHQSFGQKNTQDVFWDMFQQNGERNDYQRAFAYWSDDFYAPKYSIVCGDGNTNSCSQMFLNATITDTKVPISIIGARFENTFQECKNLTTIPLLKLEGVTRITTPFYHCYELVDIVFDGAIPLSIAFNHCTKLSDATVQSIVDRLADLTDKTSQTLTVHATVGANMTEAQKATIIAKNWTLVY